MIQSGLKDCLKKAVILLWVTFLLINVSAYGKTIDDEPHGEGKAIAENHHLDHLLSLRPKASPEVQKKAVGDLIDRLLPAKGGSFVVEIDPNFNDLTPQKRERFLLTAVDNNKLHIKATSGVAASNGFYYYLKHVTNSSVSWSGIHLNPLFNMKGETIPLPSTSIHHTIRDKYRYYQNVCTASYSAVWWKWKRWEQEIDWMALHGINLPLAPVGQELVFQRVFTDHFNLTVQQVGDFFTGPAFLAWNRMGNIQRWTGPLSEHWHTQQADLNKKILQRMRDLGMFSVTPTFGGHVPEALLKVLPRSKISKLTDWNRFGKNYSFTSFLEPEDPMYGKVTELYIKEYQKEYGTDGFYNIDLFNEESPSSSKPEYLKKCGESVWDGVKKADPNGVWVMQGWLFENQPSFWKEEQIKAMVTSVPIGRMLILDLFSEVAPIYAWHSGYYGVPFLWCMLHNFGGTSGMYAAFNRINGEAPVEESNSIFGARKLYSNMLGMGLTPEGIEQNPAAYEYMMDTIWWDKAPDQQQWFSQYVNQRYGLSDARLYTAWRLIRQSAYTDPIGVHNHGKFAINRRPSLSYHSDLWYNPQNMTWALKQFASYVHDHPEALDIETFVYDLADVARQVIQLMFDHRREFGLNPSYMFKNVDAVKENGKIMVEYLDWMDQLMSSTRFTLLSNWVRDARDIAGDAKEADYYEELARNQLTLWGPEANILDYASKHWAGLISNYYKPRWALYIDEMVKALNEGQRLNEKQYAIDVFNKVEYPFTKILDSKPIAVNPKAILPLLTKILHEVTVTLDKLNQVEHLKLYVNYDEAY